MAAAEHTPDSMWRDIGLFLLGFIQLISGLYIGRLVKQLDAVIESNSENREKVIKVEGDVKLIQTENGLQMKNVASRMDAMDKTTQLQLNNIGHTVDEIKMGLKEYTAQDKHDKQAIINKIDEIGKHINEQSKK